MVSNKDLYMYHLMSTSSAMKTLSAVNKHTGRYLYNNDKNRRFASKVTRSERIITYDVLHPRTEHSTSEISSDKKRLPVSSKRLTHNLALRDYVTTFTLFYEHTESKHAKLSDLCLHYLDPVTSIP